VAAYGLGATNRRLTGHGSAPGFRFTLYAIVSIVVMVLDQRGGWLNEARFLLQAAAYPLQLAVSSPSAAWHGSRRARRRARRCAPRMSACAYA